MSNNDIIHPITTQGMKTLEAFGPMLTEMWVTEVHDTGKVTGYIVVKGMGNNRGRLACFRLLDVIALLLGLL